MARSRNIKPGFFKNEYLAECDPLARILFAGLWCQADSKGCLEYRPKRIKIECLPYDDCDIEKLLEDLCTARFIQFYEVDERIYIAIPKFLDHQNPHKNESAGKIPEPPKALQNKALTNNPVITGQEPECSTSDPADSLLLIPDSLNLIPSNCSEVNKSPAEQEPSEFVFPVVGQQTSKEWALPLSKIAEYEEAFPGINIAEQLREARQWCRDNPKRRKRPRGMLRFLSNWLGRTQDRSRGSPQQNQKQPPTLIADFEVDDE